jgi:uncharacterized repeat protein (TIGR03803 family)
MRGRATLLAIFTVMFVTSTWAAIQERVLRNFNPNGKNGNSPVAGLIFDAAGNLYGTTGMGGAYNLGTAFELSPKVGGGWAEKVLYSFGHSNKDGSLLLGGLNFDAVGNLYGTTSDGGAYGYGTVFELTPKAGGGWAEKLLHNFNNNDKDGYEPWAGVILDSAGDLYGTTTFGGAYGVGIVFELTPKAGGRWTEKILRSFNREDGYYPYAGVILDSGGDLYGTTNWGGAYGVGIVFELTPKARGRWTEKILHSFNGTDGYEPYSNLILDAAGNVYGTTVSGGAQNVGVVFELTPKAGGRWTERLLHSFKFDGTDGNTPYAGLILDSAGNLFGTTFNGGAYVGGTVFELTPKAEGSWTEKILHNFNGTDGQNAYAGLIIDSAGNLYGTTFAGGIYDVGTVFEITP